MKSIRIKKLHPDARAPKYMTPGAACFDIFAATVCGSREFGANIWQGHPVLAGTDLAFEVPDGWVMLIFSRSGHGFKNDVRLANCVGVIDSDYRGEVLVKLTSDMFRDSDADTLFIKPGDRIAQAMLFPAEQWDFVESDELSETERGAGGIGSTDEQKGGAE